MFSVKCIWMIHQHGLGWLSPIRERHLPNRIAQPWDLDNRSRTPHYLLSLLYSLFIFLSTIRVLFKTKCRILCVIMLRLFIYTHSHTHTYLDIWTHTHTHTHVPHIWPFISLSCHIVIIYNIF